MTRLGLDYETYSEVDIKKTTTSRYAAHPSTEILMLGWAFDEEPVSLWQPHLEPIPPRLWAGLQDPEVEKWAFNANFERQITRHVLKLEVPIEQWRCSQAHALSMGFPAYLDGVLGAVGLRKKDPRGKRLIDTFSKPAPRNHLADRYDWNNKPAEWQEFCEYCVGDVEVERALSVWLAMFPMNFDWSEWFMDQRINENGLPVDVDMARAAVQLVSQEKARIKQELMAITGLEKITREPMMQWLAMHGLFLPDTRKDTLAHILLHEDLPTPVDKVLEQWTMYQARAADKFQAVLRSEEDGWIYGVFQYMGAARTGRWAGRQIQPHNLKSTVVGDDDPEVASANVEALALAVSTGQAERVKAAFPEEKFADLLGSSVRHCIHAPEGYEFAVDDLGSIESRVLGWLTYCPLIIQTFAGGRDTYKVFAAAYFEVPYEEVTKAQRKFSKPPTLGCGYQLGGEGLVTYADGMGVAIDIEEAERAVRTFRRELYPEVPTFWNWINDSVMQVTQYGGRVDGYRLSIYWDQFFLYIRLPSGRCLTYFQPSVRMKETSWGEMKLTFCYMGVDQMTNQWTRLYSYGGKLTENIVQAIARDILAEGLKGISAWLPVVGHVHDEIIALVEQGKGAEAVEWMSSVMCQSPTWAPDLLLGAGGYHATRYRKD